MKKFEDRNIMNKKNSIVISLLAVIGAYILIKNSSYREFFTTVKLEIISVVIFAIVYSVTNK